MASGGKTDADGGWSGCTFISCEYNRETVARRTERSNMIPFDSQTNVSSRNSAFPKFETFDGGTT
ncbi:hypothetical protein BDR03DRAFT_943550 [Suillus americanus]|nr:hypothetical protein BDR03DRAFT_943550 [Suillus americanus]